MLCETIYQLFADVDGKAASLRALYLLYQFSFSPFTRGSHFMTTTGCSFCSAAVRSLLKRVQRRTPLLNISLFELREVRPNGGRNGRRRRTISWFIAHSKVNNHPFSNHRGQRVRFGWIIFTHNGGDETVTVEWGRIDSEEEATDMEPNWIELGSGNFYQSALFIGVILQPRRRRRLKL